MIHLEDILDDARRYLRREMDEPERTAFEALLREHPHLVEELRFLQRVQAGFEVLEAIPEHRRPRRRVVLWAAVLTGLIIAAVLLLRSCGGTRSGSDPTGRAEQARDTSLAGADSASVTQPAGGATPQRHSDQGFGAAWDSAGALLITGIFTGEARFGDYALTSRESNFMDMFLARYVIEDQAFEWVRQMGGSGDWKLAKALAVDRRGDILVTGGFGQQIDFGAGPVTAYGRADSDQGDFFLTRFDARGRPRRTFHAGGNRVPYKETGKNSGHSVAVDPASNDVVVCGAYIGTPAFGNTVLPKGGPNEDLFLARFSPAGALRWVRAATGTYMIEAFDVAIDPAGNIFMVGYFGHHNLGGSAFFGRDTLLSYGGRDVFLAKYSPRGELLWVRQAGGAKAEQGRDYGQSVVVDRAGNAVITGFFEGAARFGDTTLTCRGPRDIFLVKYSPAGDVIWARRAGGDDVPGSVGDLGKDLSLDPAGNIYLTGSISRRADFGPFTLETRGWEDAFAAKYSPAGEVRWAVNWGGDHAGRDGDAGLNIDTNTRGQSVVTGYFFGELNLGPNRIQSAGREDIFIVVFNADGSLRFVQKAMSVFM